MIRFTRSCLLIAGFAILTASRCVADNNRLMLANQFNYGANLGYYLDLENAASDYGAVQPLSALTLDLGVGDGSQWRFLTSSPDWQYGHQYHVEAEIGLLHASLKLDGQTISASDGPFSAASRERFETNQTMDWAVAQTQYWLVEQSIVVSSGSTIVFRHEFPSVDEQIEDGLTAPRPQISTKPIPYDTSKPIIIDVDFTIVDRQSRQPLVDKYGQYIYGRWPGKIASGSDLAASTDRERKVLDAMTDPAGLDKFGGSLRAGWKLRPTGYYALTRRNGYWWLVTPLGNPVFYLGMDNAGYGTDEGTRVDGREGLFAYLPSKTGPMDSAYSEGLGADAGPTAYFSFPAADNVIRYGANWQGAAEALTRLRLRKWAFTGRGKWSDVANIPYIIVLNYDPKLTVDGSKPDVFDPSVISALHDDLQSHMAGGLTDPYLLGWSIGNEYSQIVQYSTCASVLQNTQSTPGKQALVGFAMRRFYNGDMAAMAAAWNVQANNLEALYTAPLTAPTQQQEAIREFYEDRYYKVLYDTVKSIDPNHLYLGDWVVPNWWVNASDWSLVAAHCDVVGYDFYSQHFGDGGLPDLARKTDKPILCGEYGFPETYYGARGFSQWIAANVNTDADAGAAYRQWVSDAAINPYCVGVCWFEYRDEPVTGRGPGLGPGIVYGENMAFGAVDVADQPKWDLIRAMRAANLTATGVRLSATAK